MDDRFRQLERDVQAGDVDAIPALLALWKRIGQPESETVWRVMMCQLTPINYIPETRWESLHNPSKKQQQRAARRAKRETQRRQTAPRIGLPLGTRLIGGYHSWRAGRCKECNRMRACRYVNRFSGAVCKECMAKPKAKR